jgi:predicted outer membrane repeat protein
MFMENKASRWGGAMLSYECNPTVIDCTFSGNTAGSDGGGMYNKNTDLNVTGCIFSQNSARGNGSGMINIHSNPTLTNCSFLDNSGSLIGGGICNYISSSLTVTNSSFNGNSAAIGGGMFNSDESGTTLTDCSFIGNKAEYEGGGMYNILSSPDITGCKFIGNSASDGGGIYSSIDSSPTLTNCLFNSNEAENNGGGIYSFWCNPVVSNCTFKANSATNGNGLACDSIDPNYISNIQITNCVVWDGGGGIWNNDDSVITITYSDIQGGYPGMGNIDIDPLLVDPNGLDGIIGTDDDNLRLLPESPCIDVGDNSVVDANIPDLDGNERIINGIVDMGAYEALLPIEADVHIVPRVINRNNHMIKVMAIIRLPEGVNKRDIADEPFVLEPGEIEASWQRIIGGGRGASVFALFDKADLMDAVEHNGRVEVTVTGKLKSGQYIYGSDTVRIVQPRRRRPNWQTGRRR